MSVAVPHVKTKKLQQKNDNYEDSQISAYDIILGKVEIDTDMIPQYMYTNKLNTKPI